MFNPSRLRLARQRLALTLTKLAQQSDVSLRSLTNYESGKIAPSEENLLKIAQALSVPPEFFERESVEAVPVEAVSFRKLSKTTSTKRDAVLAGAGLAVEFFSVIESRFKLPVPDIPSLDKLSAEQAAELVRRRWNLGDRPVSNMVHLLESKGVRVAALRHEYSDIDAFCFVRDNAPYVFLNTSRSAERQRFDAAHELGHLVLHGEQDMEPSTSKEREADANRFAASFLMPGSAVLGQSMSGASIDRILAARSFWKVSAMAMTHRLHELRLLSDWQYRSTCVTLSDRGYRSAEPGGVIPETSQLLRKVMFGSTSKVSIREAASELDLHQDDIRSIIRDLVPVAAGAGVLKQAQVLMGDERTGSTRPTRNLIRDSPPGRGSPDMRQRSMTMAGPKFIKHHWNRLEKGATVVVTLNKAANVRLMNSTNFNAYKNQRNHRYEGGLVKSSPFRITVPRTGSWYLTIDLIGLKTTQLRSSVTVEPPPLPAAKSAPPQSLSGIRHEPQPVVPDDNGETWDVFISHASEDKEAVAEPLADELRKHGLKVWLDKTELRIGDSLRRKIDYGLAHSSFGVVILSKSFFAKGWPQYELDGIIGMSVNGDQRMLPIWHEISRDEIAKRSPSLVDKIARNTAIDTVAEIADEIADVVRTG